VRIGLVGLSSPLLYDYGVQASRARSDLYDSPNPVLDSPYGLMLLYDELWFVCRSLCPENMRSLEFVRFLDEENMLPHLEDLHPDRLRLERPDEYERIVNSVRRRFSNFDAVAASLRMTWDARPDNHTHGLRLGRIQLTGNSLAPQAILFDAALLDRLGRPNVELVGNSFGQSLMEGANPAVADADLAHVLVFDKIPNYLSPQGPYDPVVDEVRQERSLRDFRRWVADTASTTSPNEVNRVKADVEQTIRDAQRDYFVAHVDPKAQYYTTAKTLVGVIADLIVPWTGTVGSLIAGVRDSRRAKRNRWQGFLISLERAAERSSSE
jgi:hypothetical protein